MKLKADKLTKEYKGRRVVDNVSFDIETGETVGLLGPNGAGKTTAFYMTVGLVRPEAGTVTLDGEDVTSLQMYKRARLGIGYLAQEASVFRKLTVEENIQLILERLDMTSKERSEKCDSLIEECGLTKVRKSKGMVLSGGERRRVEIARALATNPKFILLDEPFTGVDPISIGDIQETVEHLRGKGIGILITDHNVRDTLSITDRAYIMSNGQIKTAGTPDQIINDPIAREFYLGENFTM
ncbi:MAG: LPS export ABC transporter ATP-binding protein [Abditibacteriota bacterium]|nr:LPS export ABC transporter ATP-binding protein [Abditibacteriota bacterium]